MGAKLLKDLLGSGFKFWQVVLLVVITAIIAPAAVKVSELYWTDYFKKESLEKVVKDSEVVHEFLEKIREEFGADRIWIGQFYNGTYFTTGNPLLRFTLTHEVMDPFLAQIPELFRELPATVLTGLIVKVRNERVASFPYVGLMSGGGVKDLLVNRGVKSAYHVGIFDTQNKLIGIMVIEYNRDPRNLTEEEKVDLFQKAQTISGYIVR